MLLDRVVSFLDMSPEAKAEKVKIEKKYYIKLKNFCMAKEMDQQKKDSLRNGRKYLYIIQLIKD